MNDGSRRAALAAAAAGAFMGFLLSNWQVAVEPAQVLAGLVRYPEDNPFFLYQANLWTALHQACAVALRLGASEAGLSLVLGCLVPAVSFSAIALWFTAAQPGAPGPWDIVMAALVPFAALAFELGAAYPVWLVGPEHTYGMAGLGVVMLAFGLMANGALRAGGFLAALAPAVHPSLGAFAILTVAVGWPWRDRALRSERRALIGGIIPGVLLTAVSLAVHLATSFRPSTIPAADAHHHLRTFVALWDIHRPPFVFSSMPEMLAAVAALAGVARLSPQQDESLGERLLSRLCFGVWSIAVVASLLARFSSPIFDMLLAMMPLRFLNVLLLGAIPLACGRLWRGGAGARLVLAVLMCSSLSPPIESSASHRLLALMLALGVALGPPPGTLPAMRLTAGWCAYVAVGMVSGSAPSEEGQMWLVAAGMLPFLALLAERVRRRWEPRSRLPSVVGATLVLLVMAGGALVAVMQAVPQRGWRRDVLSADFRSDPLLQLIHARPGAIVTGPGVYMLQLRSRRAVLLDTVAIDFIPYVPQAAPAMARIFRDVYGSDLLSPSTGLLDEATVRSRWEGREPEEWRRLGRELGFTDVLAAADWQLRLPPLSSSPQYALYALAE